MDTFTRQCIATALWSSTDDDNEPLDKNYSADDLAPVTLDRIKADCVKFQADELAGEYLNDDGHSQGGHDFWLTRNGHGAGFWDGDWTEPAATYLTKLSKAFGEFSLYIGDDGKIYG